MRKLTQLFLVALAAVAIPSYAARGRDQSYITFDDGGTIVKQADDGREVDGRVNLPIYPGDEVTTSRRGRTEIRLADGNIVSLDRATSVRFRSILDSYESDSTQSVVELQFGHVGVQRTEDATETLRIDTPNASYAAAGEAVYALDADSRGRDRVIVYAGSIEVRTPRRSTRVHRGEEARIDDEGLYGLVRAPGGTDEFERWLIRRSERYGSRSNRYLDRSLAYSDYDLEEHGSWVFASSFGGYGWRPRVSVGWRPYYDGRWGYGPGGSLTWISYEPWGWVPYHYGRWAYDPFNGWLWLPGYTYAPAWVYWAYGPGYIGWAPSGWYDCYRPYYNWAYQPYSRAGFDFGFGFYGRVRLNEVDLRPWTFVNPNGIVSNRVDQAALTTDAIRQRLIRDPNGSLATVTGAPARFTRSELKDPAAAVNAIARRGLVSGPGREGSATTADMTPFFRRDAQLSTTVRDRIVRSRAPEPVTTAAGAPSGVPTPGTGGTVEGRVGGRDGGGSRGDTRSGEILNRLNPTGPASPVTGERGAAGRAPRETVTPDRGGSWRNHVDRTPTTSSPSTPDHTSVDRTPAAERPSREDWRGRSVERGGERDSVQRDRTPSEGARAPSERGADIPRRIIDRIGGPRISSGETPRERAAPRDSAPSRENSAPRQEAPRQERSSPPPERSSPPPRQEHSSPPASRSSEDGGGKVHRDQ